MGHSKYFQFIAFPIKPWTRDKDELNSCTHLTIFQINSLILERKTAEQNWFVACIFL